MLNYFISDTHFSDKNSLKRENRPFKNVEDFDNAVINNINGMVNKDDILWHLGDFVNYNENDNKSWKKSVKLALRINCKVILVIGNNEERVIKYHFNNDFEKFRDYLISSCGFFDVRHDSFLNINNEKFYLNHYPSKHKDGYTNLFGHLHRISLYKPFGINMSCDLNHFYPFSEEELFSILDRKTNYWDYDEDVYC